MTVGTDAAEPFNPEHRAADAEGTEREVWAALREVEDPELPVSLVDLGLVYDVRVEGDRAAVDLTLTYSGCPGREMIIEDAKGAVGGVEGIDEVAIEIVYSPAWSVEYITDRGREQLAEFGLAVPGAEEEPDPKCHE